MKTQLHTELLAYAEPMISDYNSLIEKLAFKFNPIRIINFSRNSFAQHSQGCFMENTNTQYCNYCLLLITESSTRIDHDVQDFVNSHYHHGHITVICHSKKEVKNAIAANNRFFIEACTAGEVLYHNKEILSIDEVPSFDPALAAAKASKHFRYRLSLAEGFYLGACECLSNWEQYNICLFMLHQAVEQLCMGLIRVHLAYRAEFHNLHRLLWLCTSFSDAPLQHFTATAATTRLFNLLCKSYSAARYNATFQVSATDADALCELVTEFMALATKLCESQIKSLEGMRNEMVAGVIRFSGYI